MSLQSLIPAESEYCVLRADVADRLLACGDGDGALVYLYLARRGASADKTVMMRDLNFTRDRLNRALFTLNHLTISSSLPPAERSHDAAPPRYTVADLRTNRMSDRRFQAVCQTAESVLGRTLTESQLRTLFTAYDHLGLPADVLIDLLTYLKREKGLVSRRDIEEQAYLWADMGIRSAEASAAFLSQSEQEKPIIAEMMRALDMAGRAPAPSEYRYLSEFIRQGFTPDAIALAKTRLYARIGRFSWKYLKGILDSWHEKGVHTAAEITALEPETAAKQATPATTMQPAAADTLSDWERDWLNQLNATTEKENSHGI